MVISWITRSITTQIAQSTVYIDNAKELWEDLRERFSKTNHFRVSDLLQEINSIKQGERNITEYYTDSKTLWEELDALRPLPTCVCKVKCSCNMMKTMSSYRDSERVMCFLKGLGEMYNAVKTQILLTEPLPGINRVFSLVLQHERHLNEGMGVDTKIMFNSANQKINKSNNTSQGGRSYGRGRGKNYGKQCSYCHKMNHTADECYSKHGFPPWMKQKMNYTANALEKEGDLVSETEKQAHNETLNEQIFKAFGPEQLQQLINMIQDSKNKDKVINNTIGDSFAIKNNIDTGEDYFEDDWSS
ncbi:uncharacterized protein [Phaseolus vulgaris]|uniref:uncharacterized protein n=1 Tax=Phaseolus vulgaris TaxID=3885 RepID=UPI0035CB8031